MGGEIGQAGPALSVNADWKMIYWIGEPMLASALAHSRELNIEENEVAAAVAVVPGVDRIAWAYHSLPVNLDGVVRLSPGKGQRRFVFAWCSPQS